MENKPTKLLKQKIQFDKLENKSNNKYFNNSETLDILFIFIGDISDDDRRQIPLGIAYLAGQLKKKGYKYKLLDLYNLGINFQEKNLRPIFLEQYLLFYKPKIIGISVSSYYIEITKKFIALLKDVFRRHGLKIPIMLGGYISLIPDALQKTNADIICQGEGEKTIIELLDVFSKSKTKNHNVEEIIEDLKKVAGIKFRSNIFMEDNWLDNHNSGGVIISTSRRNLIENLDEIEFPDYDIFEFKRYHIGSSPVMLPFYAQRGCYNHCTFCDIIPFYGKKYIRRFSPEYIVRWIKYAKKKYNLQIVDFMDDNFLNSRLFIEKLFDLFEKECPFIKINFQARASEILRLKDLIKTNKKYINCIEIGTESYSPSQLLRWNKNITPLQNKQANILLSTLNISYINFYLWLDEKTTIEELDENLDAILTQPNVPIIQSHLKIPNYIMSYEICAIYDRLGRSNVRNIPHLFACERFLNETNDIAQKINIFYIGFKQAIEQKSNPQLQRNNNDSDLLNKIKQISSGFFQAAEELLKRRLYYAVNLAENIKKIHFNKKSKSEKMLYNYLKLIQEMADRLLKPFDSLNLDFLTN
ncbi:MAG: B12-binding domain-containing radical SAM protein [Promethearchaeota archaeon]